MFYEALQDYIKESFSFSENDITIPPDQSIK